MSEKNKTNLTSEKPAESTNTNDGTVSAVEQKSENSAVTTAETTGRFVYIGPNLPKGLLKSGSVFKGTRTEVLAHLSHVTQQYPEIGDLLVASDKLAEAKMRIRDGNTRLASKYTVLLAKIKA